MRALARGSPPRCGKRVSGDGSAGRRTRKERGAKDVHDNQNNH